MLNEETWMSPAEAVENGFIDEVVEGKKSKNTAMNEDYSKFDYKQYYEGMINQNKQTFQGTFKLNNSTNQNNEEDEQMDEILQLLGVKTEAEARLAIANLKAKGQKVDDLEKKFDKLQDTNTKNRIETLINEKKLTEEQREFATNLAKNSPEDFETFVATLKPVEETPVYTQDEAGKVIDAAITQQKILPAQKDSLVKMGTTNKASLDEFLTNAGVVNLSKTEDLNKPESQDYVENYTVKVKG